MIPTDRQDAAHVWQDLDQAALDRAYDQAQWARHIPETLARYAARSEAFRHAHGLPQRMAYGAGPQEQLDFFSCGRTGAPVLVFVHGGAWRSGRAHDYAFVAAPFVPQGVHVAVIDFDAVQDCGGDLQVLARQVHQAVGWLHRHAVDLGADPSRLHLAGHSSGAHLAAAVATGDGRQRPPAPVASLSCCSGMYELEPVRRSSRSSYVAFTDTHVAQLSPARHVADLRVPLLVAHGSEESPQFQWQARHWGEVARSAGVPTTALVGQGLNHFEILETLGEAQGLLARAVLHLIDRGR